MSLRLPQSGPQSYMCGWNQRGSTKISIALSSYRMAYISSAELRKQGAAPTCERNSSGVLARAWEWEPCCWNWQKLWHVRPHVQHHGQYPDTGNWGWHRSVNFSSVGNTTYAFRKPLSYHLYWALVGAGISKQGSQERSRKMAKITKA